MWSKAYICLTFAVLPDLSPFVVELSLQIAFAKFDARINL